MNYQKIFFATDFSKSSEAAFQYATSLARDSGALLMIVHVQEAFISYPGGDMLVVQPDFPNPELQKMLDGFHPQDANVRCESRLVVGAPAEEIVRLANESHADLIVIGSHGRTGVTRLLMGSVAEVVMRKANCPVLTVKARSAEMNPTPVSNPSTQPCHDARDFFPQGSKQ